MDNGRYHNGLKAIKNVKLNTGPLPPVPIVENTYFVLDIYGVVWRKGRRYVKKLKGQHIGSSFEDFLKEEGISVTAEELLKRHQKRCQLIDSGEVIGLLDVPRISKLEDLKLDICDLLSKEEQQALYEWMHESLGLRIYK